MISRRFFLCKLWALFGMSAVTLSACKARQDAPIAVRRVRIGTVNDFIQPQRVLFLERIVVRRDDKGLSALSLTCTHQSCMVKLPDGEDNTFVCPCHGSRFDASGAVLQGPAQANLPWLPLEIDSQHQVWVTLGKSVTSDWRLPVPG